MALELKDMQITHQKILYFISWLNPKRNNNLLRYISEK